MPHGRPLAGTGLAGALRGFSAPSGPRDVAAGGARPAARRATRNPWKRSGGGGPQPLLSAPRGRRNRRAWASVRPLGSLLRPAGANKGERTPTASPSSTSHGFRVGPPCGRDVPPAATAPRPAGAETTRKQSVRIHSHTPEDDAGSMTQAASSLTAPPECGIIPDGVSGALACRAGAGRWWPARPGPSDGCRAAFGRLLVGA